MGGSNGVLGDITNTLFGKPQTVATPDYTSAALQTSAANSANNRINQVTPYGNSSYQQTGTDQYGNPTYTMNTTAAPFVQNAINAQGGQLMSYANPFQPTTFNSAGDMPSMNYYGSTLNKQQFNPATQLNPLPKYDVNTNIDTSTLPSFGINPGQTYSDAIMQRLQPQMAQDQQSMQAQLANQGIVPGTEAYNNQMRVFNQGQNDQRTSAVVGGINTGLAANNQVYGQRSNQVGLNLQGQGQNFNQGISVNAQNMNANDLAFNQQYKNQNLGMNAQNQAFTQDLAKYLLPGQVAGMLKNLSTPTYAPTNTVAGTDYLTAMGLTNQGNVANANANNAYNNAMMQGLFTLGAGSIASPTGTFNFLKSDIRVKENIKPLGFTLNGLNIYSYEYKPEFKDDQYAGHGTFIGVMAQEVEKVMPEAVITMNDGYKAVNYSMLGI
jgi:hypothetical protein